LPSCWQVTKLYHCCDVVLDDDDDDDDDDDYGWRLQQKRRWWGRWDPDLHKSVKLSSEALTNPMNIYGSSVLWYGVLDRVQMTVTSVCLLKEAMKRVGNCFGYPTIRS